MAQAQQQSMPADDPKDLAAAASPVLAPSFKFNAQAREFVPSNVFGGTPGPDWVYIGDQYHPSFPSIAPDVFPLDSDVFLAAQLDHELRQKIINQVEYMFSDISLVAHDSMAKRVSRESEGYVPISVIASAKRVKPFVSSADVLAHVLRSSPNLVVSSDGKKVKRRLPFTEKQKEDLQSRTVLVENLPEDHSNHKLESIFGAVGRVRNIRICHPQEPNNGSSSPSMRSKGDLFVTNKLHALIEYDTMEAAENAVNKLNDERDWRKGLRVRLLLRRSPKSVLKNRKPEFDSFFDDDELPPFDATDDVHQTNIDGEEGTKKGWGKGGKQGKSRGSGNNQRQQQNQDGRGPGSPTGETPPLSPTVSLHAKGPRMPDGTRGFSMGRGKSLVAPELPLP
ncbi:hypothetical protein MLD38_032301 [Melastoma candidum]|uniref:Uncharacterized protein n=1 Tax=Melastoma candidum TaxID=119954 RepID=A0ACB9M3C5_9MYRT|nr:hypothetical protein MLD38_032301 [Melastoma candidum]